jgi:hypothetical protein
MKINNSLRRGACLDRSALLSVVKTVSNRLTLPRSRYSTLKMEATCFSETPVLKDPTRRHIQEDGILQTGLVWD